MLFICPPIPHWSGTAALPALNDETPTYGQSSGRLPSACPRCRHSSFFIGLTGVKWLIKLISSCQSNGSQLRTLHSFLSVTAQQLLSHNQRPASAVLDCYLYLKIIASTAGNHVSIRSWILQFQETMSINSWCFNSKMCHLTPKLTCLLHTD